MLSIGRITAGAGYEYLVDDVATSKHDYYAGRGEAPGIWWGESLGRLGLSGQVAKAEMEALYGLAVDPFTGEALGRRFPTFKDGREPIAALDLTFSPVKSVSGLWALADEDERAEIQAAHDAAVSAALGHLQDVAGVSRAGVNGVRTVETDGWIVARFRHRQSRAQDPQLHTHCAVLNRVFCPDDGWWRTLDSRAIYRLSAGGGGVYTRTIEDELSRRLGVEWRDVEPDGAAPRREIIGVPSDLLRLWSKRRAQVEETLDDLDEPPRTAKARAKAAQAAVLRTRPNKGTAEESPHERWQREAEAEGFDIAGILADAAPGPVPTADVDLDVEAVFDRAVERLEASSSTWRRGNMVRAVAEALPAEGRHAHAGTALVEDLTTQLERSGRLVAIAAPEPFEVPPELQRPDGSSIYRPVASTRWTTPEILASEERIVGAARRVDPALVVPASEIEGVLTAGHEHGPFGDDQVDAVRDLLDSGRTLDLLVGPAGSGKTTTMRAVVDGWEATGGRVVGLAVAQTAAETLADGAGCRAENIARWLLHTREGGDPHWRFRAGDLVLVDEVGMVPTGQLDEIRRQAEEAGAKLIGVGDPLQLGPVGAGGAARLVAQDVGATYLHELHRFSEAWEADASLRLRSGDTDVVAVYEDAGRVHGGDEPTVLAEAQQAWLADHQAGKDALLLAASSADVADLAGWCRDELVANGEVDDKRTADLRDGNRAGAGDLIVTRRNDRRLGAINRDRWLVDAVTAEGALAVRHASRGTSAVLPVDYVSEHVELGYAQTVHAAQGRTVDTCHLVAGMGVDREVAYVGLTRGRHENHAYMVCEDFLHDELPGGTLDPGDALRAVVGQEPETISATEALRDELATSSAPERWQPVADDLAETTGRRRVLSYLTHRFSSAVADDVDRDPACAALVAMIGQAPTIEADPDRVLAATCRGDLTGADSVAQVLTARAQRVLSAVETGKVTPDQLPAPDTDWSPPDGGIERYADQVNDLIAETRANLDTAAAGLLNPPAAPPEHGMAPPEPQTDHGLGAGL